ncbi:MAG: 8-oxo-dGTP diphosphatase MutT [Verrucomicrobiota bacterium]
MKQQSKVEGRKSNAVASGSRHATPGTRHLTEVSAALIFHDGKLLITRRHSEAHLGGLWEFPGGKREPDETFEQCLVREIREELGVEISVGKLFESVTHAYPEKTVRLKFFVCRLERGEPQMLGCAAFKWISAAELDNYQFPAADTKLLGKLPDALEFKL